VAAVYTILFILTLGSLVFWIIISSIKYKSLLNPILLYSIVWLIPMGLSMTGLFDLFVPQVFTVLLILVNVYCFNISCFLIKNNRKGVKRNKTDLFADDYLSGKKKYIALVMANILCILWLVPFIQKMLPFIVSGNWVIARSFYLLASTNHTVYTVIDSLFLQWIITPLFYATALIAAYFVAKQRPNYFLLVLSIFDLSAVVLATAGRNAILKYILFFVFAYLFINENKSSLWRKIKDSSPLIKLIMISGVLALSYITLQRRLSDNTTVLENIYVYFVGPIAYFNNILENTSNYGLFSDYLFGRATFGFITTPLEIISSRLFNVDYNGVDNIITSYVSQYVNVTPNIKGNAFSTSLYPFMMDFGWLGVVIGPAIFGQIVGRIFRRSQEVTNVNQVFWKCLMVFFGFIIFFSEWEYELIFPYTAFVMLYLYIFFYKKRIKIGNLKL